MNKLNVLAMKLIICLIKINGLGQIFSNISWRFSLPQKNNTDSKLNFLKVVFFCRWNFWYSFTRHHVRQSFSEIQIVSQKSRILILSWLYENFIHKQQKNIQRHPPYYVTFSSLNLKSVYSS